MYSRPQLQLSIAATTTCLISDDGGGKGEEPPAKPSPAVLLLPASSLSVELPKNPGLGFIYQTYNINKIFCQMAEEEYRTLVEILEDDTPIDIIKYIDHVRKPQCGAITTFSGTTRDTSDTKKVMELRYEAYVPMAIRCLRSICASARLKWSLNSIAVAHKLGAVPVGETSVFIAVSSVHRVDALDACKFLIDELKATVPIWKKEVYENGEVWKENTEFIERRTELGKADDVSHKKGCCGVKIRVEPSDVE